MKPVLSILLAFCTSLGLEVRAAAPAPASPPPPSTPAPPPSAPAKRSAAELEKLAMPIALHSDPLVSIILPASVYPVEIVLAARFVTDTNNIAKLDQQPWDENVKAVARFPELIAKMSEDLDWTVALGQAFLEQRKELMDTIQALRAKAQQAGTLKTTEQQIVVVTNTVVEKVVEQQAVVVTNTIVQIQPSNPEVIYVPSYPPTVYYPPPAYYGYPYYYGYGYYPYAPLVTFGVGMAWGAAISHWNHCDWHGGDVDVDINQNFRQDVNVGGGDRNINRGDRNRGNRPQQLGDRGGAGQRWQPDQGRLQRAGAPSAKTREARGWGGASGAGGARPSQRPSFGSSGTRPSQQPSFGAAQRPASRPTQPSRSPSAAQRPANTGQRQGSASSSSSFNRPSQQRSSAFSGVGSGGGSTRNYSNRGSSSRGGGGFSGGRGGGGGGRGGGGRGGRR